MNFILEIVDHLTGQVKGTLKGTPEFIAATIRDELYELGDNEGITITRDEDE